MCVFRPVLQRFGSDIAHVLHVKAGGCGSSANQCTAHVWKWRHVLVNMKSPISLLSTASILARVEAFDKWRHKLVNQSQATSETAGILSIFLREVVY